MCHKLLTAVLTFSLLCGHSAKQDVPLLEQLNSMEIRQEAEEHLLITTTAHTNGTDDTDGVSMVLYDYHTDTGEFRVLYDAPYHGLFPANAVDFDNQILYLSDGNEGDGYDNLFQIDLKTGESKQLTDGKFLFDVLMLVDGNLYASTARQGANVCQPAVFDFTKNDFTYRNPEDDDTWHHSFSYNRNSKEFLILTCSDDEMRTHRVAAETHIRPKTISNLSMDFQTCEPVYFTEDFEIRLTRRLDDNHILMTADPRMGASPRKLRLLTIDTQEVQPFEIPGIRVVYLFEVSADESRLFFIGARTGETAWRIFEYEIASQKLTELPLPETVRTIADIQYVLQY